MTKTIFESKTEGNWFLGSFQAFNYFTCFGNDESYEAIQDVLHRLLSTLKVEGLQLHVVQMTSDFQLLAFLVDMINQEYSRHIKVTQHKGAILVSEDDQLFLVHLPKEGTSLEKFFDLKNDNNFGDTILIATHNEGKTKEFRELFGKLGLKVENLNDYPDLPEVEETGMTFEENARLKAETISKLTGKMVISDDSGLKVDALGGLPGVWSARFSGPDATDARNNAKLLHELAMVFDKERRSAQFHTTLVVSAPNKESLVVEAEWPGYIGTEPKGENGFGYDPLFIVGEGSRTAAELSAQEKNNLSHRGQAVRKLMEVFPKWQLEN
ncbi:nucleoside-triphosphate diphosphatase [Streptococcus agalactiae]|uniref:nucleoside-triphosphate diphosphatase n=1 Tax=Streptococcus agalactiae TaxID=1311 RepID=UPI0013FD00FD|nr:nucleoside-triphosphate diphosphatase [Streptococcus agalactiae]